MARQLLRVQRVYKEIDGSNLLGPLTTSWTDGSRLAVEAVTDFNEKGGEAVLEPGTVHQEVIEYSGVDEATDELVGVTRPNTRSTHAAGMFVQEGLVATVEKFVDGYLDDEDELAVGIPVPSHLYAYFRLGTRAEGEAETVWVDLDAGDDLYVASAAVGAVPILDEDLEVLPPGVTEPVPPVDEIPVSGTLPVAPVLTVDVRTLVNVEPTWFLDWSVTHTGLRTDGSPVIGLKFRVEVLEGTTVVARSGDTSGTSGSLMVEGDKDYTVRAFALDIAGQASAPDTEAISTEPDDTIPATPTGLALTGGANGGGHGIIYGSINRNTETDFSHFEIHASTTSGFTASDSTIVQTTENTTFAVVRTVEGTFGYTTTVYVKVKAVDTSTNKSPATAQASGTAEEISSADITDLQSDNYVPGSAGWRITKSGNLEANNGSFRGSLIAATIYSISSDTDGIMIDGSIPAITIGDGLFLNGTSDGAIEFGSNCAIFGSGAGQISVGSGVTITGSGSGQITVGSITLDGATGRITGGEMRGTSVRSSTGTTYVELSPTLGAALDFFNGGSRQGLVVGASNGLSFAGPNLVNTLRVSDNLVEIPADGDLKISGSCWVGVDNGEPPANHVLIYKSGNSLMAKAPGRAAVTVAAL